MGSELLTLQQVGIMIKLGWTTILSISISILVCESFNLDHLEQDKRGYQDADDPRNLFAAMYGGVYKRSDPYELDFSGLTPEQLMYLNELQAGISGGVEKIGRRRSSFRGWSGLKDPYDPRNLFHSIYGGIWKRK